MTKIMEKKVKWICLWAISFFILNTQLSAQTVTISSLSGSSPRCSGTGYTLNFTTSSNFPVGNVFTAQLSDASGSFTDFETVGSVSDRNSGSLTVTIPTGTTTGAGYRIRLRATNGTLSAQTAAFTINERPSATISYTGSPFCRNEDEQTVNRTGTAGGTYSAPGGLSIDASTGEITPSSSTANTYTVTYTMTAGGCPNQTATTSINITNVAVSISASSSNICEGASVTFTATPTNGGTPSYQWKLNGGNVGTNSNTYSNSNLDNGDAISCVMTATGTCTGTVTSNTINMTVNTPPTITNVASTDPVTCPSLNDGTITVSATGSNLQYSINNGGSYQASNTFTGLSNGTYNIRVRNSVSSCFVNHTSAVTLSNSCLDPVKCYHLLSYNSTKIVEVENNSVNTGANIIQRTYTSGPHQQWKFTALTGGYYRIQNVNSGYYAEVPGGSGTQGISIQQNTYTGPNYQQWTVSASGGLYSIINRQTGYYMDIEGASTADGARLIQWVSNGGNNQRWNIVEAACMVPCSTSTNATITASTTSTCINTPVSLSVPDGGGGITYAWTGTGLSSTTVRNPTVTVGTVGTFAYTVVVSNSNGCTNTSTVNLTFANNVPSVSIAVNNNPVCAGVATTFTATPTNGGGTPSYQWRVNGSNVGTGTATYSSSSLPNGAVVSCVMTTSIACATAPTATSNNINMTVNPVTAITTQPVVRTICSGGNTTFTVAAAGTGLSYQWRRYGTNLTNGGVYSGVTTATLTLTGAVAANAGDFSVSVSGSCGSNPVISDNALLTVNTAPAITSQPSASTVCVGGTTNFSVVSSGAGLTYQWRENGVALTNTGIYSGVTTSTLTLTGVTSGISGRNYSVVVSGSCTPAATSNNALLTVNPSTAITTHPATATICAGTNRTFTVVATGIGLSYQWRENGVNISNGGVYSGATTATLTLTGATILQNNKTYSVQVTGTCGVVLSNDALLTVNVPPTITSQPSAYTTCNGANATFGVVATGGNLNYQWREDAVNVTNGGIYSGTNTATLTLTGAPFAKNGKQYSVVVSNGCTPNATSTNALLTVSNYVTAAVSISTPSTSVCAGSAVTFTASPSNGGTPTYQWKVNGSNVGTNSSTFTTSSLANGNTVTCVMTSNILCANSNPATSNSIAMTVNPVLPASVSISTPATTVCAGSPVTFTASPTNGGTPSYQWKINGSNAGTNSSTFTTSSLTNGNTVTCEMTSSISCVSGNPATSNSLAMTVNPVLPVSVSISTPSNTLCVGTSATFTAVPTNGGTPSYQWKVNGSNVGTNSATFTSAGLNNNDHVTCVMTSSITCVSNNPATSNTVTMTMNPIISNNTIGNTETVCYNTGGSLLNQIGILSGGNGSYTYQWQSSNDGVLYSDISGANSASYQPSAVTSSVWYNRIVTSGGCSSVSAAVTRSVTVGSYQWTGNVSSNWNTSGNWCSNVVPTSADALVLVGTPLNQPVVNGTGYAADLTIGNGITLTLSGGSTLNVSGNWSNSGTLVAKDGSTVRFVANSGTQELSGSSTQRFHHVTKSAGSTLKLASDIEVARGGVLTVAAGTFDMDNRSVLLKSKVSTFGMDSTASLGVVTGTITNSANFTTERYISAGRGIRYISSPVAGATVAQLKDSVQIPGPVAGGFDSPNISISTIREFVEWRSPVLNKGFVSLTNINAALGTGKGYSFSIPGKRTTVFPALEPVTLRLKGIPNVGTQHLPVFYTPLASAGWNLVGNPYPSAIDWDNEAAWTKNNMDYAIYLWDPTVGSSGAYYAYVAGLASDARMDGSIIQSGQGFFVKANAANPALIVTENAKSTLSVKANFRQAEQSYVTLKITNQVGDVDFVTVRLDNGTGSSQSATKILNTKINVYAKFKDQTTAYAIAAVADGNGFEVPLYFESPSATSYVVEVVKVVGHINPSNTLKIKDQATGKLTDVHEGVKLTVVPDGNTQRLTLLREAQSNVITSTDDEQHGGYHLYPTHINVHQHPTLYSNNHAHKHVEVYNVAGVKVAEYVSSSPEIALDDFDEVPAGLYKVKVTSHLHKYHFTVVK